MKLPLMPSPGKPSQLSPTEVDREIELIDKGLTACEAVAWEQHALNRSFPDFEPVPTFEEMHMGGQTHNEPTPDANRIIDKAHAYASRLGSRTRRWQVGLIVVDEVSAIRESRRHRYAPK